MFKCLSPDALGLSTQTGEMIELALSFGFKGLEFHLREFAEQARERGLPYARRLIDSAKLRLGYFRLSSSWQIDETDKFKADLALLAEHAQLAAEVGCTRAITLLEPGNDERPYHQQFEFCRQRLIEIVRTLEPLGIRLGVGFQAAADRASGYAYEFVREFDALMMLVKMVPAKGIGIVFDPWEVCASGGTVSEALNKLVGNDIVTVQLADAVEDLPAKQWPMKHRLLPGEGDKIDCVALLTRLAELGYDGPVTPAPDPARALGQRRDTIVKAAGAQLDLVWKATGLNAAGKLAPLVAKR